MTEPHILVRSLSKTYHVPERKEGLLAAMESLVHRRYRDVKAVNDVSFCIEQGEMVGFIGPNGAGKTTTMKVLAAIYRMSHAEFRSVLDELIDLLEIEQLLSKLVRNLSLGERMRCELAAAMLHRPRVLFLDEPTLGLDVSMQLRLRHFLAEYNRRVGATMILTSHYMADVTTLCSRVILIDQGKLLYDGDLTGLAERMAPFKLIRLSVDDSQGQSMREIEGAVLSAKYQVTIIDRADRRLTLRVEKARAAAILTHVLGELPVVDISVEDPPIEAVIDQVYREGVWL
jgi:ABC-2 type transport system ATP-binding protein